MTALGHEAKLIAPQYVRPFVKRHKNDHADAEAIVIAARQPEMRFVELKAAEQQARAVLFRSRERLVHQRTELVNALRAVLYEYGHVIPKRLTENELSDFSRLWLVVVGNNDWTKRWPGRRSLARSINAIPAAMQAT